MMDKSRQEYQREYYQRNKERILEQRKRCSADPERRKKINKKRRASRRALEVVDKVQSLDYDATPPREVDMPKYKMRILHPDRDKSCICTMYTLRELSIALNINQTKVQHWIYLDKLPHARYRDSRNWRLYTEYEVEIMKKAFFKFRKKATLENYKFRLTKELSEFVQNKFSELVGGVPLDQFVPHED